MNVAVQHESLHWSVVSATILVHKLSHRLYLAKHVKQALPFILHAVLAMESHARLRHPRYIPWRCKLVALACGAYRDLQESDMAKAFIQHMTDELAHIRRILSLNPVPLSHSIEKTLADADETLIELRLTFELCGCTAADAARQITEAGLATEACCISALLRSIPRGDAFLDKSHNEANNGIVEELHRRIALLVKPVLAADQVHGTDEAKDRDSSAAGTAMIN